jgi:hypothetical protein
LVAVSLLLGTGLFASVLAPPAAVSVIRDHSVHGTARAITTTTKPSLIKKPSASLSTIPTKAKVTPYQGLAQLSFDRFMGGINKGQNTNGNPDRREMSSTSSLRRDQCPKHPWAASSSSITRQNMLSVSPRYRT